MNLSELEFFLKVYHGDLAFNYTTVQDITYDSDSIYEVSVTNTNSFEYKDIVFTLSEASVNNLFNGEDISTVKILETGGTLNNVEYLFEEGGVLKPGDTAIVYLKKYIGPIPEAQGAYVISGVYQGKFDMDKSTKKLTPAATEQEELSEVQWLSDLNLE
ncbi:hypothetical protein [Paenibacillus agri]|uniref:Uncharacterized protein n=1 Tax=Paenibacillus agri TaxID=2744309 RepID=A0A850EXQ1_9BACL|nr:hypothetical protein [Paenibacillus agri]NUU62621.1 hypothetical protein [Paenibacillus agri]